MNDANEGTPAPPGTEPPVSPDRHTGHGAPTDGAHQDAGDGSLTGSTPAGLTVDELLDQASGEKSVDGATG